MNERVKKILKIVIIVLVSIIVIAAAYLIYVFAYYHRLPDNLQLEVTKASDGSNDGSNGGSNDGSNDGSTESSEYVAAETEYTIVTYNVGFGAYTPDFSFFMDGGKSSWAESSESVVADIGNAGDLALSYEPDFVMFQELDTDSTRSYHVNELELMQSKFSSFDSVYAVDYDSPFLMYPFNQPHGTCKAGIATFSSFPITSSVRRSLPVSNSVTKMLDLDRCYSVTRIPTENGKELILINVHMSAYGGSEAVRDGQTSMLKEEMAKEYALGNYVIVGGDFNHDLKALVDTATAGWAHAYDRSLIPETFDFAMDLLSDEDRAALNDSCRDAGSAYYEGIDTYTLDGFIISDNITLVSYENESTGFAYSDHDPVVMKFILNE